MNSLANGIALLGAAGSTIALAIIFLRANLNIQLFMGQITKLAEAGNLLRAMKLCSVIPHAVTASGVKAVLAVMERPHDDLDSATLRQTYEKAEEAVRGRIRKSMGLAALSEFLVLAGLGLVLSQGNMPLFVQTPQGVVVLVGAVLGIAAIVKGSMLLKASQSAGEQIVAIALKQQMNR